MKLMTLQQYAKMSKPALIRRINLVLWATSKEKLARLCYNMTKAKLPHLFKTPRSMRKRKSLAYRVKLKKKRKFSRKQLAAQRLFAKRARAGTLRKRRR